MQSKNLFPRHDRRVAGSTSEEESASLVSDLLSSIKARKREDTEASLSRMKGSPKFAEAEEVEGPDGPAVPEIPTPLAAVSMLPPALRKAKDSFKRSAKVASDDLDPHNITVGALAQHLCIDQEQVSRSIENSVFYCRQTSRKSPASTPRPQPLPLFGPIESSLLDEHVIGLF